MKRSCDHLSSLKPQKISNFIQKSNLKCSNPKHPDKQINLCLQCGQARCTGQNQCSMLHYQSSKHPLVLRVFQSTLYCYVCDVEIDDSFDQQSKNKKKIQKQIEIYSKIKCMIQKRLQHHSSRNMNVVTKYENIQKKNQKKTDRKEKQNQIGRQLGVFGLANIGNTCFFNSVLQCMYSTIQIHQLYDKRQFKDGLNGAFKKFLNNHEKVYCPKSIFSLLSKQYHFLKGMGQQDAFQLYVLLIDSLIESASNPKQPHTQKIEKSVGKIFGFNSVTRLECMNCERISWNQDFNLGLTVPLAKNNSKNIQLPEDCQIPYQQIKQQGLYYPSYNKEQNILTNYFSPQLLSKSNSFKCQKCSQSTAIHKFYIKQPPQVLTINFKKFNNFGTKINSHIPICEEICLDEYCLKKGKYVYELFAGVVHSGSSGGGHYVAHTKRNNQWYYFSDSHFKASSFNNLRTSSPYVIFYRRVNFQNDQEVQKVEEIKKQKQEEYTKQQQQ